MIVRRGLLRILWREALPATLLGSLGLGAYTLLWPEVMTMNDSWSALLVVGQCLLLAGLLGQFRSPAFAFLYSRGYSRDVLWGHMMLASALSLVVGWLPAALIVWTGLRSAVRDHLFQSPYFPVMAPFETSVPLGWLALSLLLTPAFHYTWIRRAQPTRGGNGGHYTAFGLIVVLFALLNATRNVDGWFARLLGIAYVAVVLCSVLGGRILHRSLEVRA
jgi:hypothetical protein